MTKPTHRTAVSVLWQADPRLRARLIPPLAGDPVRTLRIDAGRALVDVPATLLTPEQQRTAGRALDEYVRAQRLDADRAEAHLNLGALYAETGKVADAEREYRTAIKLNPRFPLTYVNLSDLYRLQSRDAEGERVLREALTLSPGEPRYAYVYGVGLYSTGERAPALAVLQEAHGRHPWPPV